jgi:hypothetical protein
MWAASALLNVAQLERYPRGTGAAPFPRRPLALSWPGAGGGMCALRHNKRMHPTADTNDFMLRERLGAAGDAGRYAACRTSIMERIRNSESLTAIFGRWPSFHDAEIHSIYLNRGGGSGPFLEAKIHVYEMTKEVDAKRRYILKNHTLVTFRFSRVAMGEIKWFNQQNVISHFGIDEVEAEPNSGRNFKISITSSYGCEASFECEEVTIISVEPLAPAA